MSEPLHDLESEKAQELKDRAEKWYRGYLRNVNVGDIRDTLEEMMDDEKTLVNLLQSFYTENPDVFFANFKNCLHRMFRRLAEQDAEREP